ncbi:hypothetical protein [Methylobacterium trifolii]|uniref:hypothetical protein n=1 Tax=Methylobacterium trifolii TaxID=1003092 RepID=UPI001EDD0944|nr:hypothetical protein [Methylobacterium trifolii]
MLLAFGDMIRAISFARLVIDVFGSLSTIDAMISLRNLAPERQQEQPGREFHLLGPVRHDGFMCLQAGVGQGIESSS